MRIILDNNIWISFMIGKKLSLLKALFLRNDIHIYVCDELIDEFCSVSGRPKIRKYISEQDIEGTLSIMDMRCTYVAIQSEAQSMIRDAKDLYLLSLADTVQADFIVTGDKDLLVLENHNQTQIITFSEFSHILSSVCEN